MCENVKLKGDAHSTTELNILEPKGTVVVLSGAISLIFIFYVHWKCGNEFVAILWSICPQRENEELNNTQEEKNICSIFYNSSLMCNWHLLVGGLGFIRWRCRVGVHTTPAAWERNVLQSTVYRCLVHHVARIGSAACTGQRSMRSCTRRRWIIRQVVWMLGRMWPCDKSHGQRARL